MATGVKTGGRQAGTPNKLTKAVKDAFGEAFQALQEDPEADYALMTWGKANPDKFYPLAAKLIPTELNAHVTGSLDAALALLEGRAASRPDRALEE